MFKSLLRTIPSLSGNFTIGCKLNDFNQITSNEYETYVREGCLMPLQNSLFTKNIELNLVKDQHEYVVRKFYNVYSNMFYKANYSYNKNNFAEIDEYESKSLNNGRNKDYEFGCKRLYYKQQEYQFSFYAPFYIDDVDDLPEYFMLNIRLNDNLVKHVKIYIDKENTSNYLRSYLKKYVKHIDNRVIFCLPESKQAAYFGIDVKKGGLVKYVDNVFGNLYNNQNTINNFDYMICNGFERNGLIMRQIIPLSFLININDIFNYHEKKFFSFWKLNITGYYYDKENIRQDFYDFSIDYTDLYEKYLKYDEETGEYKQDFGYDSNDNKINIMNVGYPSLNESKYAKYRFTNKITPTYCRFKLANSSDDTPYITNMSYAFSELETPNKKYGEFPTMFKDIFPKAVVKNENMYLPIGESKINEYDSNKSNIDKYVKLMSNFYSTWYNIYYDDSDMFKDSTLWSTVDNEYSYFRGVLYKTSKDIIGENIDRFGVFLNINMSYIDNDTAINDILGAKYVLTNEKQKNSIVIDQFTFDSNICKDITYTFDINGVLQIDSELSKWPQRYRLEFNYNGNTFYGVKDINAYLPRIQNDSLYTSFTPGDITHKEISYKSNLYKSSSSYVSYLLYNEKMKRDKYGSYVLINNYYNENKYYNLKEIKRIIINQIGQNKYNVLDLENEINKFRIHGYEKIDIYKPINLFNIYYTNDNVRHYRSITETNEFIANSWYNDNAWYIASSYNNEKIPLTEIYSKIKDNVNYYDNFRIYIEYDFINEADLLYFLNSILIKKSVWRTSWHPELKLGQFVTADTLNEILTNANNKTLEKYDDLNEEAIIERYNTFKHNALNSLYYDAIINGEVTRLDVSLYHNEKNIYMDTAPLLPSIYGDIEKLDTYNFCPYEYEDGLRMFNFFVKNKVNDDHHVYVDTYNLNKYIELYNKDKEYKIPYLRADKNDGYIRKSFFARLIDRTHISKYCEQLIKAENAFSEDGIDTNNINFSLLDNLYVKERVWYIDKNEKITIKDRYIQLYEYFKNVVDNKTRELTYVENLLHIRHHWGYDTANNLLINMISKKRNVNDKFEIFLDDDFKIELDLVFYKEFIQLNNDLYNMMLNDDRCYLYLYYRSQYKENADTWKIYYEKDFEAVRSGESLILGETYYKSKTGKDSITGKSNIFIANGNEVSDGSNYFVDTQKPRTTRINELDDFLMPLFNNVYINDVDVDVIYSMIHNNKIYIDTYVNNENYFKEINVDSYVFELSTQESLNNALIELGEEPYEEINDLNKFEVINKIKEHDEYFHETYIPSLGLTLYSIYNINHLSYNNFESDKYEVHKGKDNIINILTDENGTKYGFYFIDVLLDNTNNTFNINNSYDVSTAFKYINNKHIMTGESNSSPLNIQSLYGSDYIKSIFRIINPFLKVNIFKSFVTDIKNVIVFPNEMDININYVTRKINPDDESKYVMLKKSETDTLYEDIIKYTKERRIKLLRYFNYITPLIQKKTIIENVWENKYIYKENNTDTQKYNILYNTPVNIYKYNPLYVVNKYDDVINNDTEHDFVYQYEYKHFNDNSLYNLEEEFIISLKDIIDYDQLVNEYETEEKALYLFKKYVNRITKKQLNINIILFLFNKYVVSYQSDIHKLNSEKTKKLYKISYKFTLK